MDNWYSWNSLDSCDDYQAQVKKSVMQRDIRPAVIIAQLLQQFRIRLYTPCGTEHEAALYA
jgi:hypothetical protein